MNKFSSVICKLRKMCVACRGVAVLFSALFIFFSNVHAASYTVTYSTLDAGTVGLPVTFKGTVTSAVSLNDSHYDTIIFRPRIGGTFRVSNAVTKNFGSNHTIVTIVSRGTIDEVARFYGNSSVNVQFTAGQYYTIKVQMLSPSSFSTTLYSYTLNVGGSVTPDPGPSPTVTCTVYFNANGGYVSPSSRSVTSGSSVGALPTPTRSGYTFDGWYTSASGGTKITSGRTISGNVTFYAHWTKLSTKPDLAPHKPDGWASSMVLGKSSLTQAESYASFSDTENIYLSFAFLCSGETVESSFYVYLYIDGKYVTGWSCDGLEEGYYVNLRGYNLGKLSTGTHTIKLVADATGRVSESNESNNSVTRTVTVASSSYSIRFIRNEGSGNVATKTFKYGVKTRLPSLKSLKWERRGFVFKGWATSTANARAGKIWKGDWANVSTPVASGKTLTVYAVWKLKSGYYAIRFNKDDGSGKWRELGYEYGKSTRLPTISGGLGWTRSGYQFYCWKTNWGNWLRDGNWTSAAIAPGKTLNVYAVWRSALKTGDAMVVAANARVQCDVTGSASALFGYYSGLLADGTGTYDLFVDEGGETGYVRIVFDDGDVVAFEADICFSDGETMIIRTEGVEYALK